MTDNNSIKAADGHKTLFGEDLKACIKSARGRATRTQETRAVFLVDGDYTHMAYRTWAANSPCFVAKVSPFPPED